MKENLDYALGLVIGSNLRGLGVEKIDSAAFLSGVEDLLLGRTPAMDVATAQRRVAAFLQEQEARRSEGLRAEGVLPGGLEVQRKAVEQQQKLARKRHERDAR